MTEQGLVPFITIEAKDLIKPLLVVILIAYSVWTSLKDPGYEPIEPAHYGQLN